MKREHLLLVIIGFLFLLGGNAEAQTSAICIEYKPTNEILCMDVDPEGLRQVEKIMVAQNREIQGVSKDDPVIVALTQMARQNIVYDVRPAVLEKVLPEPSKPAVTGRDDKKLSMVEKVKVSFKHLFN
jgi:hypothetical protein